VGSNPTPSARKPEFIGLFYCSLHHLYRIFIPTKHAENAKLIAKAESWMRPSCFLAKEKEVLVST